MVSALIHLGIVGGLAAVATTSGEVIKQLANLDSALVTKDGKAEETDQDLRRPHQRPRDQAVGDDQRDSQPEHGFTSSSAGGLPAPSS